MRNICLTVAYDGTPYGGWQIQKNSRTIQGEIQKALKRILKENVTLTSAGRTDSGVHAKAQTANFRTKRDFPLARLRAALNANLPKDISIIKIKKAPLKFHSQFDAKSKVYRYAILNGRIDDPFLRNYYYKVPYKLDVSLMQKEAKAILGKHNFRSFQARSDFSRVKSAVRTVRRVNLKKDRQFLYIDIEADGFLYNMVRNIVGTLIEIGRGSLREGSMRRILESRDRRKAGPTVPAKGLMLVRVKYGPTGLSLR